MVILGAWGIAQYSLLFPHSVLQITLFRDVLLLPYFQMQGEYYLDIIQAPPFDMPGPGGKTCTDDPEFYSNYTELRCPSRTSNQIVTLFLVFYILITNLLLLNILLAIFNTTFSRIEGMSRALRYLLSSISLFNLTRGTY